MRRPTRISAALVAVVVLGACTGSGGSGGSNGTTLAADQTLKFPILGDFGTLDPGQANANNDLVIGQNLFDGLLKFDTKLDIVPDIAASLPTVSSDGLTYAFTLRRDVTFSNGDKVTAKDVLYSWNRAAALQGVYAYLFTPIVGYGKVSSNKASGANLESLLEANDPSVTMTGVTAPDGASGYAVEVKLIRPAGYFESEVALGGAAFTLVDENVVKTDFNNWWTNPATMIGTGPFKMTAYIPKQSVDFAAVPNWWGSPKPTVKKIHIDIVGSAASAITAYEQGSYDIYGFGGYSNAPIDAILRIQGTANEKSQLLLQPMVRTTWVGFNLVHDSSRTAVGPFLLSGGQPAKDLRLAFALAVDKAKLATIVCHDILCQTATGGLITKGLIGYGGDNTDPLAKFDPTQAKQLLRQGDPDGSKTKNLTYTYDPNNPIYASAAQVLQDQWQTNLGVHVNLQAVDHSAFVKASLSGTYILTRTGWQADYNHPQDWFDGMAGTPSGCPDVCDLGGYATPAYDAAVAAADAKPLDQALPDYQAIMKMLQDDVAYIPLYYTVGAFLIKPYVKGAGANNFFDYYWDQIQILSH